jgi:hypothetical protein
MKDLIVGLNMPKIEESKYGGARPLSKVHIINLFGV